MLEQSGVDGASKRPEPWRVEAQVVTMAETFKPSQPGERVVCIKKRCCVLRLDDYPVVNREPCATAVATLVDLARSATNRGVGRRRPELTQVPLHDMHDMHTTLSCYDEQAWEDPKRVGNNYLLTNA